MQPCGVTFNPTAIYDMRKLAWCALFTVYLLA